jgi:tetratricopeptide (TPR) repeat protein
MSLGRPKNSRLEAILAFFFVIGNAEFVVAAPVSSECPNFREPLFNPLRPRNALRVLILKFYGQDEPEQKIGSEAAQALRRGLEQHIRDKSGLDAIDAGLSAESIQTEYLNCAVNGHREARNLGRIVDADVVFWGTTWCDRRQPEHCRIEALLKGSNHVSAKDIHAGGDVRISITQNLKVNTFINPSPGDPLQSSIKTYMTVVHWRGLQTEAKKGVEFTGPVHNLEFPKLAAEKPLALFRFVIGIYAFFNRRYQLAAQRFREAEQEMYAGSAQRSDLYRLIGTSYLYVGEHEKGINNLEQALTACSPTDSSCRPAALLNLGWAKARLGRMKQALNSFEEALALVRQVGDISGEATSLNNIASVWDALGRKTQALSLFENALQLRRKAEDLSGEAITLNNIGSVYDALRDRTKALSYYERAMVIVRQQGDISGEAIAFNNMGVVQSAYGDHKQALSLYKNALSIQRQIGDIFGEAATLSNMGIVYDKLGNRKQSLDYYNQALSLKRKVGDVLGEANILSNIGTVLNALKDKNQALSYLERALALQHQTGIVSGEATTLNNIGIVLYSIGESKKALRYLTEALRIQRQVSDLLGEAATLNNIGNVYAAIDRSLAMSHYKQALQLIHELGNSTDEARALVELGILSVQFGESKQGLKYFEKALALQEQAEDVIGQAITLEHVSATYLALDDKQQALTNFEKTALLKEQIGDNTGRAIILNNTGSIYSAIGKREQALGNFEQALFVARETGDLLVEAISHNNLGAFFSKLEDEKQALPHFEQAFSLCTQVGHVLCEILTRENMIFALRVLGRHDRAAEELQQANQRLQSQTSLQNIREKMTLDWISKPNLIVQRSTGELRVYRFIGTKPTRLSVRAKIGVGAALIAAAVPFLAGGGILISQALTVPKSVSVYCNDNCWNTSKESKLGGGSALVGVGGAIAVGGLVELTVSIIELARRQSSANSQLKISPQINANYAGAMVWGSF